jgi:hypothetical protein
MPAAIPVVVSWFAGSGITATVANAVVYIAASAAIGQALAKKALDGLSSGSPLQMSRDPAPVARVIYGECRVSGPIVFAETQDDGDQKNDDLYLVILLACHEVAVIGPTYYRDDTPLTLDGSNAAIGDLATYYKAYPHLGTSAQTVDTVLDALSTAWASDCRLRGLPYVFWKLKHSTKYMGAVPNLSCIVRGRLCFDPRNDATAWTDNPALCLLDYLTNTEFGLGADLTDEIDEASFIAAANACDEEVGLAGGGFTVTGDTTSGSASIEVASFAALAGLAVGMSVEGTGIPAGAKIAYIEADTLLDPVFILTANATATNTGTVLDVAAVEKRYRCGAVFDTDAEPATIIEQMVASMAGELYYSGGRWICHAGAARTGTVTITDDDLAGAQSIRTRDPLRDTCNRVKGTFTFPGDHYVAREFPAVVNATYLAEDDGQELWRDLALPWVQSAGQAQRIAKITLELARQDITHGVRCKLTTAKLRAGDIVLRTSARYGWTEKPFRVVSYRLAEEGGGEGAAPALLVDLDLREYSAAAYDWTDGAETTVDPSPNTNLPLPA